MLWEIIQPIQRTVAKGSHLLFNRRQALISLVVTAVRGVAWSLPWSVRSTLWGETFPGVEVSQSSNDLIDTRLRADIERLASRVYSEEGIPVFLACVNLVPDSTLHKVPKAALTPLSTTLASAFRREVDAYQRIRPGADAKAIAPLIEVLADRDFSQSESAK